jgi:PIN domain nuclease of toxin-antitoxin system
VKLLLDTCTFLWLAAQPTKLSPAAAAAIDNQASELYLSDVSIWEVVLKHGAGKLPLPEKPREWIPKQVAFFQLRRCSPDTEALFRSGELPPVHHDPFDRLIAAQALTEPFHLISPDLPFREYGVSCIW